MILSYKLLLSGSAASFRWPNPCDMLTCHLSPFPSAPKLSRRQKNCPLQPLPPPFPPLLHKYPASPGLLDGVWGSCSNFSSTLNFLGPVLKFLGGPPPMLHWEVGKSSIQEREQLLLQCLCCPVMEIFSNYGNSGHRGFPVA